MNNDINKHLSSQFNSDLNNISNHMMEMGGLVEQQMKHVLKAIDTLNVEKLNKVVEIDKKVNQAEVDLDEEIASIIARRQPTARDLRLILAVSKVTSNLNRTGNELVKITEQLNFMINNDHIKNIPIKNIKEIAHISSDLLSRSLYAFARLDIKEALDILKNGDSTLNALNSFARELISFMTKDISLISGYLELMMIVRALEKISDHSKNLAELIIYVVKGENIRYLPFDEIEQIINKE